MVRITNIVDLILLSLMLLVVILKTIIKPIDILNIIIIGLVTKTINCFCY